MRTGVFALLLIPAAMMGDGVRAQSLPDFGTCDARIWLTQGSSTRLNLVDTSTNPFTFVDQGNVSYQYNGSAFNPLDNYGYGVRQGGAPRLSRIGSDGQTEDLGAISGVPSGLSVSSGDIADDGSYYVFGGTHPNRLYKIDIGTVSATSTTLSRPLVISDLAWSNGLLYSKENNSSRLISIDPATGSVTNVGDSGVSGVFGSMFGSPDAVYGSGNGGEGFYKFNTTTGRATRISSAPGASTNDGMKCATSRLPFAADIAISKTDEQEAYTAGEDVVYDIVVTNNGIFGATHITVSDPLPAGITAASWTCTGAGGGQCGNASGTGAISGELVDLPVDGTVTYQLTMTVPSDFTGDLINEASVIVPDDVQDDDLSNNTATDTDLQASLSFVKEGTLDDVNGNGLPDAGEPIVYTFTVTNTGDAPLTNVTIDDPDADVSGSIASLAPGASDSSSITGEHILTTEEIQTGSFENNASASAQDPDGDSVEADSSPPGGNPGDPSVVELLTEGDVGLEKASSLNDANGNGRPDAGETIDYVFTVTNTGNVTLTDVAVTDDRATVSGSPIASLDPGVSDSTSVTGVYEVTQADVDAGSVENVAEATGKDPEGNDVTALSSPPGGNPGDPTVTEMPQEGESDFVKEVSHEDANGNGLVDAGERLNYVFTVENTGNVTLSDVTVSDDRATVVGGPIASLAPGESDATTITGYYDVTQADIDSGSVDNVATATGKDPGGNDVTQVSRPPDGNPGDTTDLPIEADGTMSTVKEAALNDANGNGRPDAGETIDYVFTVTNTGNVTLTDVAVTDDRATVSGSPIASLDPGVSDSTSVTGVYEVTQADVDAGSVENVAEATGKDPEGNDVTALSSPPGGNPGDPTVTEMPQEGESDFVKEVSHEDANGNGLVDAGERLNYVFTVENTGNVTLSDVTVSDDRATVVGGPIASLAPGESDATTITGYYDVTQADIDSGSVDNVATATGKDPGGNDVTQVSRPPDGNPGDSTGFDVEGKGEVDIVKEAALNDANGNGFADAGETIDYVFTVTNTGNVTLTDVAVTDDRATVSGSPIASLAPGVSDSTSVTGVSEITQADIDAGSFENVAEATGTDPSGEAVSALSRPVDGDPGDPTAIAFEANPVIELELVDTWVDADGDGYPHPGEAVVYAFKLRNSGNVTVENIAIASLEVEADVGAASASGLRPRASVPVSGGTLASLSPGDEDETTFTASYPLSQADIDAGAIVATAVKEGVATDGTAVSDGSDDPHDGEDVDVEGDGEPDDPTATLLPHDVSLALEKAGSFQGEAGRFAEPGDTILYTFTVTNDGNVSVTDVTPADEGPRFDGRAGGGTLSSFSPSRADLEAGESATFTATYTVTQGDIDAAQGMENGIENTATASGTGPRGQEAVSPEAEATVEFPGYSITKTTPLAEVRRGGKVPYTIRVKAMGLSSTSTMNIVDMTPPGLSFVPGSALLDGAAVVPVVEGRKLTFEDVELVPDEPVSIDLDLAVTAAAKPGEYVNRAWVEDLSGTTVSRIATAVVEVVVEAVFDCGDIIGKVFDDKNRNGYQDGGEPGLAGVRIATVKGLLLTADDHGRFHVACADLPDQRIGTNYIMKLDPRSLPSGYRLTTENPRVVRLTAGKASEFLFGASIGRVVRLDLGDAAFVEGASALRPEWEARIVQMMALLEKEPSVLRLVYASAGEGKRLAQQRLKVLRKKLARDWRKAGSRYRLEIETRIISAQNHNIRPQKNVVYK